MHTNHVDSTAVGNALLVTEIAKRENILVIFHNSNRRVKTHDYFTGFTQKFGACNRPNPL